MLLAAVSSFILFLSHLGDHCPYMKLVQSAIYILTLIYLLVLGLLKNFCEGIHKNFPITVWQLFLCLLC